MQVHFLPVALQSLTDLGRLTYRRFLELFRHMVGLLGRVISPSQGLYLHSTTQHRKTWTDIHALSGIRTHDPSNQPVKTHASDRTVTVTGVSLLPCSNIAQGAVLIHWNPVHTPHCFFYFHFNIILLFTPHKWSFSFGFFD
jgi:hypothetical protein